MFYSYIYLNICESELYTDSERLGPYIFEFLYSFHHLFRKLHICTNDQDKINGLLSVFII